MTYTKKQRKICGGLLHCLMRETALRRIDTKDRNAVAGYLTALLNREAFDRAGFIYGIGHAVYSESDPRAGLLMKNRQE